MKTYPIMLDLRGRVCVVVGTGPVGLRKARALVEAGATVRLVGPARPGEDSPAGVERLGADYSRSHLAGALLVFACTDDGQVNARVAADARALGALVNVADAPAECDFLSPATFTDGEVVLAVGTGGASPALARVLRDRLAGEVPPRTGEFASALRSVRGRVRQVASDPRRRRDILAQLASRAGYERFVREGLDGLLRMASTIREGR